MTEPLWQSVVVWLCVAAALLTLVRRAWQLFSGDRAGSACGGCQGCDGADHTALPLVSLELTGRNETSYESASAVHRS